MNDQSQSFVASLNTFPVRAALLLSSSLTVMAGALITPGLPGISAHFADYPAVWVKLIVTLPAFFIALFSPLMGWLSDRYGRLPVLKTSLLIYALAGAAGGLADSLEWMLTTRALLGVGVAGIMGASITLVGDYFTGQARQSFMGLQSSFMALGGVIYINLGGSLALLDWRAVFLVYLAALLIWVLVWRYLYEPMRQRPVAGEVSSEPYPWRSILPVYFVGFVSMALFYMMPVQIPFLLAERFEVSSVKTAWVISASTLAGVISGMLFSRMKNHFSHVQLYSLTFLLFAVGYFLVAWAPFYPLMLLAVLISGLGVGLTFPTGNHWLLQLAPEAYRARVMGGAASVMFSGQFLSPLLISPIEAQVGLTGAFQLGAILALVMGLFLWFYGWITGRLSQKS